MIWKLLLAGMLSFPCHALAVPPCMLLVPSQVWEVEDFSAGLTRNGGWLEYFCRNKETGGLHGVLYLGDWLEISQRLGGKLRTIVNAADPLKALQTLPNRATVLPVTDSSLSAIYEDWWERRGKLF